MKFLFAFALLLSFSTIIFAQRSNDNEPTKQLYASVRCRMGIQFKRKARHLLLTWATNAITTNGTMSVWQQSNGAISIRKTRSNKLKKIDRAKLSVADQLNYDLFQKDLEQDIERFQYKQFLAP